MGKEVTYKTPKAVFLRLFDVIVPRKFEMQLAVFLKEGSKQFLEETLGNGDLWDSIVELRKEAATERSKIKKDVPLISSNCETDKMIQESVLKYMQWKLTDKRLNLFAGNSAFHRILGLMIFYGLQKELIKPEVHPEVATELKKWKAKGIKIYTIAKVPEKLRYLAFKNTTKGDLSEIFEDHLGTQLDDSMTNDKGYKNLADGVGEDISKCLFVVESMTEAKTVTGAGAECCVMLREGKPKESEEPSEIGMVTSLEDIVFHD